MGDENTTVQDENIADLDAAFSNVTGEETIVPEVKSNDTPPVETPSTETTEVQETKEVTQETEVQETTKSEDTPATETPATEETKELKPFESLVKPPVETKPVEPSSREAVLRDLGVEDSKFGLFKQMSNDAFNYNVEVLRNYKEAVAKQTELQEKYDKADKMPDSYYDHPEGYTLSKDYKDLVAKSQQASYEYNHYVEQMKKIRAGEKWHDLVGYNQDGSPQLQEKEADTNGEVQVNQMLNALGQFNQNSSQKIAEIQAKFNAAREGRASAFVDYEKQFFPQYEGVTDNQYINSMQALLKEKQVDNNPMAGVFSKLYAYAMEVQDKYNASLSEIETLKQNQKPATENPTESEINTTKPVATPSEDTLDNVMDAFEKRLAPTY